ncbi:hypothetical protein OnM2_020068, partial [Erysiphe neolycopersici]
MDSIVLHLARMCPNPRPLIKCMHNCNVVLGGLQATSLFYPLVSFTQSPWDFYFDLRSESTQTFLSALEQITMLDVVQDSTNGDGYRLLHLRGNVIVFGKCDALMHSICGKELLLNILRNHALAEETERITSCRPVRAIWTAKSKDQNNHEGTV